MKVWLLEWRNMGDSDFNVTVWTNQKDALEQCRDEIIDLVDGWDMDDEDAALASDQIHEYIRKGNLELAMQRFNEYQDNYNADYAIFYDVREVDVLSNQNNTPTLVPPAPTPYQATTAGATCRQCGNPNEYAYADRSDGTYCCRQCATFKSIFGTP